VNIEPIKAACCSKHFHRVDGLGLLSCGDCSDSDFRLALETPNSHLFSPALSAAILIIPLSSPSDIAAGLEYSKPLLKKARPPGIVLLC
jgi:hypothetical protein